MLASLKRMFGASQPEKPTVAIRAGENYQWRRGLQMEATEKMQLAFPGQLVKENEQIGSIIEADDDAEIGFEKNEDGNFVIIYLRLNAGHKVQLHRSSDFRLVGKDGEQKILKILSPLPA